MLLLQIFSIIKEWVIILDTNLPTVQPRTDIGWIEVRGRNQRLNNFRVLYIVPSLTLSLLFINSTTFYTWPPHWGFSRKKYTELNINAQINYLFHFNQRLKTWVFLNEIKSKFRENKIFTTSILIYQSDSCYSSSVVAGSTRYSRAN